MPQILILSDDPELVDALERAIAEGYAGVELVALSNHDAADAMLRAGDVDTLIVDAEAGGDRGPFWFCFRSAVKARHLRAVILDPGHAGPPAVSESGAFHWIHRGAPANEVAAHVVRLTTSIDAPGGGLRGFALLDLLRVAIVTNASFQAQIRDQRRRGLLTVQRGVLRRASFDGYEETSALVELLALPGGDLLLIPFSESGASLPMRKPLAQALHDALPAARARRAEVEAERSITEADLSDFLDVGDDNEDESDTTTISELFSEAELQELALDDSAVELRVVRDVVGGPPPGRPTAGGFEPDPEMKSRLRRLVRFARENFDQLLVAAAITGDTFSVVAAVDSSGERPEPDAVADRAAAHIAGAEITGDGLYVFAGATSCGLVAPVEDGALWLYVEAAAPIDRDSAQHVLREAALSLGVELSVGE